METRSSTEKRCTDGLPLCSLRLLAPPLRLVSAAMWQVVQRRDVLHYGKLEEFVTCVSDSVPELLTYRHKAKLTLGLQARMILELCRGPDTPDPQLVLSQLTRIKPPNFHRARNDAKVEASVSNFQELVHTLLSNPAERALFFQEVFPGEYGAAFDTALEKLLWEFLCRLDQLLPVPDLAQTVSWLSAAPVVLEEYAQSASQPQLLSALLQHQRRLGHLHVPGALPSSLGDSILSSLSLPLSGRVMSSNQLTQSGSQSETKNASKGTSGSTEPAQQGTSRRQTGEEASPIRPMKSQSRSVNGRATPDLWLGEESEVISDSWEHAGRELRSRAGLDRSGRSQGRVERQCGSGGVREKNEQRLRRKTEEEDDQRERQKQSEERASRVSNRRRREWDEEEEVEEVQRERQKQSEERASRVSNRRRREWEEEEEEVQRGRGEREEARGGLVSSLVAYCLNLQPRILVAPLKVTDTTLPALLLPRHSRDDSTQSREPQVPTRKRKLSSSVESPEKENRADLPITSPGMSPWRKSRVRAAFSPGSDEIIIDSEDEETKNFKGRLFGKRYVRTKHNTYVPTLREFWRPSLARCPNVTGTDDRL